MRTHDDDRVGLGWRGELAAATLEHLDEIDVLEVIADNWLTAPRREVTALEYLARERPVMLHGVSLGLASSSPVEAWRMDRMARLVERVRPEAWSEHLAFVRAGGVEIGHLAAPPRTLASAESACANLARAARIVGALPCVENIATLIDPPGSIMDEARWVRTIVATSGAPMLIDLHNLYANALSFGHAPEHLLLAMPLDGMSTVHLSGGRWISPLCGTPRLLDDHLHDVPTEVYDLLESLACAVPQPLTVIIERDGNFPRFDALLRQLTQARAALARGRADRARRERAVA